MEQHLHRGRALAAFNLLLSLRASKLKDATEHQEPFKKSNIQSDVQAILSPLSLKEWSLLPSVCFLLQPKYLVVMLYIAALCMSFKKSCVSSL